MPLLFACPAKFSAPGFHFVTNDEFHEKASRTHNPEGKVFRDYNFRFIEGDGLDAQLFNCLDVDQDRLEAYLDACETWHEDDKLRVIICVNECGYQFDLLGDSPEQFDLDLYDMDSMEELARYFVEEGLLGEIPEHLRFYIDYEAIARDLFVDYCQTVICGRRLIYRYA